MSYEDRTIFASENDHPWRNSKRSIEINMIWKCVFFTSRENWCFGFFQFFFMYLPPRLLFETLSFYSILKNPSTFSSLHKSIFAGNFRANIRHVLRQNAFERAYLFHSPFSMDQMLLVGWTSSRKFWIIPSLSISCQKGCVKVSIRIWERPKLEAESTKMPI